HQLARRPTRLATGLHSSLRRPGRVVPAGVTVATHLTADGRGRAVDQAGDPAQAEALGMTDLNGGAFFNAEFGIGHRGNTVPERSGVALSFCGRPFLVFHETSGKRLGDSDVEAEVHHVAVLDDVILAFQTPLAGFLGAGFALVLD